MVTLERSAPRTVLSHKWLRSELRIGKRENEEGGHRIVQSTRIPNGQPVYSPHPVYISWHHQCLEAVIGTNPVMSRKIVGDWASVSRYIAVGNAFILAKPTYKAHLDIYLSDLFVILSVYVLSCVFKHFNSGKLGFEGGQLPAALVSTFS
jgi:hypothetical protein